MNIVCGYIDGKERFVYLISFGSRASKHLAGLGGGTMSEPRLLGVLDRSIRREPSAAEKGEMS